VFGHALHQTRNKTEIIAPNRFCCRLLRARIASFENNSGARVDQARALRRADADNRGKEKANEYEEDALEKFVLSAGATEVPIEARCIRGNTGLAASDFVQSVEADLLVVPVETSEGTSGQLPNNIAWIIDVIPCNLWVIR